jgi:hypothetical protein
MIDVDELDRAHLRRLVAALSDAQLRGLRDAFAADRAAGAPSAFCNSRIDAIERELDRRRRAEADSVANHE